MFTLSVTLSTFTLTLLFGGAPFAFWEADFHKTKGGGQSADHVILT
jgi:hypothetical protein